VQNFARKPSPTPLITILRGYLVTLGPDVHQALLKACSGACTEADLHLLQHKDLSVGDLEPILQLLAEQAEK